MKYYSITPRSREEIRELAKSFRTKFNLNDTLYIPVVDLLDKCALMYPGFNYEILPDSNFKVNVHATTSMETGHISIRESVYERACQGAGRDRMTIAHEIGHYVIIFLKKSKLTATNTKPKIYRDPEWQAKCFAGELMVNYDLSKDLTIEEIENNCGVSHDAAMFQFDCFHKEVM